MSDSMHKTQSSDTMSMSQPDRHRANSYEYQPKRVRKGSISGRLRYVQPASLRRIAHA